jgi:hypothetical protein
MEFLSDWNVKNLKNDIEFHSKLFAMTKYVSNVFFNKNFKMVLKLTFFSIKFISPLFKPF